MDDVLKDLGELTPEEQELLRRKLQKLRKKKEKPAGGASGIPRIPRRGQSFPLSFAQQRLWFLDQLRPEAAANNIPLTVELVGELQPAAFEGALRAVVERHEVLRTAVVSEGGRPSQRFDAPTPAMTFLDVSGQPPEEQRRKVEELARSQALEPFDLSTGPLLRTVLVREAAHRHVFVFTIHHLIFDRWSVGLLLGELGAEYQTRLASEGTPASPLQPLPVQYGDFAAWEQQRLTGELLEERMDFWRRTLDGYDPRLDLPTDHPRPAVPASRGGTYAFSLDATTADALNRLSVDEGASLFMTLLAAFHGVLARLAEGAEKGADIGIGLSVSHRGQRPLERLVGCFTNHLVVRARLEEESTLRQLLATVREATLGALAHQDLPAEKVVEVLREQGRGEAGLFQVLFRLNNQPLRDLKLPGLELDFLQVLPDKAPFDLDLSMEERDGALGGGLEGLLVYSTDLFEPATAEAIAELYRGALAAMAADPDQPLAALEMPRRLKALRDEQMRAEASEDSAEEAPELPVAVAATFTADLVREPLELWLEEAGWNPRIELAPYNQVFQQLLDPSSALAANRQGVNLVLLRLGDWVHYRGEGEKLPSRDELQERVGELLAAFTGAAEQSPVPWLVAVCPSPDPADQPGFWRALDARLAQGLEELDGVYPVTAEEVASLYPVPRIHDAFTDQLGHVPFTPDYFTALGTLLARRVVALRRPPFKVVAVDCDNTLWDGACAEVGADGVGLGPARRRLQEFLVQQRDAGMLVALVSKNADADVVEVFRRRPEMPLSLDHVVARKISWEPKSQALRELAAELGFGLDRFVFLDDNPVECAEVRASCPAVTVLQIPEPADPPSGEVEDGPMAAFLAHAWPFDRFQVTDEDRRRAGFYQANRQREAVRRSAPSLEDFLAGLELEVDQQPLSAEDVPRVAQMTHRVTQFNATTEILAQAEVTPFLDGGGGAGGRVIRVRDRFGDYGLVGCSLYRRGEAALEVRNLLMSCRTLGRGVEHRMVAELGQVARSHGLEAVEIPFRPTHRNAPMARFLEQALQQVPGARKSEDGEGFRLRLPAAEAARWQLRPEAPPPEPAAETAKVSTEEAGGGPPSAFYQRALELHEVDAIAREVSRRRSSEGSAEEDGKGREAVPYVAPRNPIEEQVAQIWCDVLGLEKIGVHEHFFRIGGHSLLGTVILSRIQLDFDVDLPLMAIFDNPTVEGIGRVIEELLIGAAGEADLEGLEELSEEEVQALLEEEQELLRGSAS